MEGGARNKKRFRFIVAILVTSSVTSSVKSSVESSVKSCFIRSFVHMRNYKDAVVGRLDIVYLCKCDRHMHILLFLY